MKKITLPKFKMPNSAHGETAGKIALASLSYLFILVLIPLFFAKKDNFIAFHVKQGIALLAVWVIGIFSFFFPVVPIVVALIILACIIYGLVNVIMQKERPLPVIGRLAL